MKNSTILQLIAVVFLGNFITGCNSDLVNSKPEYAMNFEKVRIANSSDEIATAQKDVNSDFEKFIVETNAKINRNEGIISRLNTNMEGNRNEMNMKILVIVDDIGRRNSALRNKLDNYVSNGSGNWKNFRTEFNSDLNDLSMDYNNVALNIKR